MNNGKIVGLAGEGQFGRVPGWAVIVEREVSAGGKGSGGARVERFAEGAFAEVLGRGGEGVGGVEVERGEGMFGFEAAVFRQEVLLRGLDVAEAVALEVFGGGGRWLPWQLAHEYNYVFLIIYIGRPSLLETTPTPQLVRRSGPNRPPTLPPPHHHRLILKFRGIAPARWGRSPRPRSRLATVWAGLGRRVCSRR